jgi:hypothetical protein
MPTVETLRPTITNQDTTGGGYVLDAANAFDVNAATYSRVIAENVGQYGAQVLSGFPADTFPDNRSAVVLELDLARFGWTAADRAVVWFRPTSVAAWTMVGSYLTADLGTVLTAKTANIAAIAGVNPATGFEVAVQFLNDVGGDPPFPQS